MNVFLRTVASAAPAICAVLLMLLVSVSFIACGRNTPSPTAVEKAQVNAENLHATLRASVTDPVRLQQMLTLTDQLSLNMQAGMSQMESLMAEQDRLYRAYDSSPEALNDISARIDAARKNYRTCMIRGRCDLAQLATDDEWKKIIARDLAVLGN